MPRNGSGTSTVINIFVIDTIADPDEVNANFTDVADQLTNSLPRDGQAGMNAPLPLQNGTVSLPALTFTSDTDSGIYRSAANKVGIAAGGSTAAVFTANGVEDTITICDPSDGTKRARVDAGAITTGSTRVMTAPDRDINISAVPKGYLYGLTLSNNVSDATNDIDIAAGEAADEGTAPWIMVLASTLTKRLDAAWAVGSGNGGLDTGSIANTTYHIWLIQRSDTGVVDALFSASATSPTMPTNYDRKRRIGSILRVSGAILGFSQNGDDFLIKVPTINYTSGVLSTTAISQAMNVPVGIVVDAKLNGYMQHASNSTAATLISSLDQTDNAADATNFSVIAQVVNIASAFTQNVRTNTSGQVRIRGSTANITISITTYGWVDTRGRV